MNNCNIKETNSEQHQYEQKPIKKYISTHNTENMTRKKHILKIIYIISVTKKNKINEIKKRGDAVVEIGKFTVTQHGFFFLLYNKF